MRYYDTPGGRFPSVTSVLGESVTKPWMPNYIKKWAREALWDMVNNSGPINSVQPEPCRGCEGQGQIYQGTYEHTMPATRDMATDAGMPELEGSPVSCGSEDVWGPCPHCEGQGYTPVIVPNIEISDIQFCLDAHKRHSEKALNIGSFIHNIIESFHKVWDDDEWFSYAIQHSPEDNGFIEKAVTYMVFIKEFYPEYHQMNNTYFKALKDNNIKVIESEQTIWHPMGYAGTLDLICEMDGKLWIGDIKTFESKQYKDKRPKKPLFKKEHYAQTEAYRRAFNEKACINCKEHGMDCYPDQPDDCPHIENRFILWLDKRDQSNYYLEIIEESLNDKHWDMWCTAFNHFKAWK